MNQHDHKKIVEKCRKEPDHAGPIETQARTASGPSLGNAAVPATRLMSDLELKESFCTTKIH